jgi:WD40 repeat protein
MLDPVVVSTPTPIGETVPFLERLKRTPPAIVLSPPEPTRPTIPGYTLTRLIGRGGMGLVYEAMQQSLGRAVAVKVLADGPCAPSDLRERFQREGQVIARLRHPNIVQVIEVGEFEGTPYLVLEYVAGQSLADHLTGTPWAPRRAAELVRDIARGIETAHELLIIHRDLKPGNVLLDGVTPKVADFGLASLRSADAQPMTRHSHRVLGTPEYSAPEQLAGPSSRSPVGPAADVYALGAILYELLTARPPFSNANPVDTITQVLHADPIWPTRLDRGIPRDIETICLKCLEKHPRRRYPTAAALADDLDRFLDGKVVSARPVSQFEQVVRWFRRHPVHLTLTLTAFVLLLVSGVFLTLLWQSDLKQSAVERQARRDADQRADAEEGARRAATRRMIESEVDLNLALCEQGEVVRGLEGLRGVLRRGEVPPEFDRLIRFNLAGWQYRLATPVADLPLKQTAQHVALTPDGSLVMVAAGRELTVWETRTGVRRSEPVLFRKPVGGVRTSSDGKTLVAFAGAELATCSWAAEGSLPVTTDAYPADIVDVAFAAASDTFAVATADRRVRLVSIDPRQKPNPWRVSATPTSVSFRPDGSGLFVGTVSGSMETISMADSAVRTLADFPTAVRQVAATRSGSHVAVALADNSIEILDAATGKSVSRPVDHRYALRKIVLPGAADIVIGGYGEGQPHNTGECIAWHVPSGQRRQSVTFDGEVVDVASSLDGSRLLAGGGHRSASLWVGHPWRPTPLRLGNDRDSGYVRAVALDSRGSIAAVSHHPSPQYAGHHSPSVRIWRMPVDQRTALYIPYDGLYTLAVAGAAPVIAAADRTGGVAAWDAETGHPIGREFHLPHRVRSLTLHPAGELAVAYTHRGYHLLHLRTGAQEEYPKANNYAKATFSNTGEWFALNSEDKAVDIYRTTQPDKPVRSLPHGEFVVSTHFSKDDRRIALCGLHGTISVRNFPDGAEVFRHSTGSPGQAVAFSPDAAALAVSFRDRTLSLLNADTGQPLMMPILTTDIINRLSWTSENQILASGVDGTVRLYDALTGRAVGPTFPVTAAAVALSPTSDALYVGEADSGIRGWKLWRPVARLSFQE